MNNVEILGGTEHILLVDDDDLVLSIVSQMLKRLGYKVSEQNSSSEALRVFTLDPEVFDLVITDMTMPKMTGYQLAEEIKAIKKDMPIILCTGFSQDISEEKTFSIGISNIIMKPIVKQQLAEVIRETLNQKSASPFKINYN